MSSRGVGTGPLRQRCATSTRTGSHARCRSRQSDHDAMADRQAKRRRAARRGGDHPRSWRRWRRGSPGAFGLQDDCALITPAPGTELVLKTDPVAEGVHFLADDAPEDIAWKALAVNVSDLAAKAARPLGYLMALSFPAAPTRRLAGALRRRPRRGAGPLRLPSDRRRHRPPAGAAHRSPSPSSARSSAAAWCGAARRGAGDALFVSGTLGDAALGLALRKDPALAAAWGLSPAEAEHLRRRYARPEPRLGARPARCAITPPPPWTSPTAWPRTSPACARRAAAPRACASPTCRCRPRLRKALAADPTLIQRIVAGGDDYEVLATVPAAQGAGIPGRGRAAGVPVTRIGATLAGHRRRHRGSRRPARSPSTAPAGTISDVPAAFCRRPVLSRYRGR